MPASHRCAESRSEALPNRHPRERFQLFVERQFSIILEAAIGRVALMQHDHSLHGHSAHGHAPPDYGRAFAIGIALNVAYVAAEAAAGFVSGSLALLADAGRNLGDVLGLSLSWWAAMLSRHQPTGRFTYGLRSTSILSAGHGQPTASTSLAYGADSVIAVIIASVSVV